MALLPAVLLLPLSGCADDDGGSPDSGSASATTTVTYPQLGEAAVGGNPDATVELIKRAAEANGENHYIVRIDFTREVLRGEEVSEENAHAYDEVIIDLAVCKEPPALSAEANASPKLIVLTGPIEKGLTLEGSGAIAPAIRQLIKDTLKLNCAEEYLARTYAG